MNTPTSETASIISFTNQTEELNWYFQDIFNQIGNLYGFFKDINCLVVECPLEFILFEIQNLTSFLQQH